ncbi:glycosyltransferase [Vibrio hepatarius]|uniref:glycosyltransferase n=1 Tax=Vibrio hepatarius TaxID=171383 RepID=UPI00142E04B0|nr:glycosyltransferase [Vibrio hepatarius]
MKIFFRISKLGFGGAEQVFLSLAKEFKKIEGTRICFVVDRLGSENVETAIKAGHEVYSLDVSRTMKSIIPFAKLIKVEKPDIIISAYTDTNAATLLSALITGQTSRVIVTEHASLTEHWRKKSKLKKQILKFYVSHIYKLSQLVICVSKGLSSQVTQLMGSDRKVSTIYNPVRFGKLDSPRVNNNKREKTNLVAVGRITEQKDYPTLIQALAKLTQSNSYHLTIVGGVFCEKEYRSINDLINSHKLQDYITFTGYTDKVEDYYQDADIFVLSSAWEGFGNVIVEAMSFGLPVISTNCNYGPAEILENGKYGRLVPVADSDALADAILQETHNPLVTKEVLIARSKDFSEKEIAEQYLAAISEVVNANA